MSAAPIRILMPSETLMLDIRSLAEAQGLVLITDGRELAYTLPNMIPLGWRRFVLVDKPARPLEPTEPQA